MMTMIVVDVQSDFTSGGALEVPGADRILPVINGLQSSFELVVATQDWHPGEHSSFASNHHGKKPFDKIELHGQEQILWPDHCVQGSEGAVFHPELYSEKFEAIFRKGMDVNVDSYSGFYDNLRKKSTGLAGYLREKGVAELYITGLAADFCVYFSVLDALDEGFKVTVVEDAVCALDLEGFVKKKEELTGMGVRFLFSEMV